MSLSVKLENIREELERVHQQACQRDNSSTLILESAFESNASDLIKAITAALMTIGGKHAPIKYTYMLFKKLPLILADENHEENLKEMLDQYEIIPGFGNSFHKDTPDPMLAELDMLLVKSFPEWDTIIKAVQVYLSKHRGLKLYPNLATYTAIYAILNSKGISFCEKILIESRIPVWINILENGR